MSADEGPHQDQPLLSAGTPLEEAEAAVVLVHGRGATAESILGMGTEIHREGVALLAPQAAGRQWYPNSFLQPVETNEPGRTSGLQAIASALEDADEAGIPAERAMVIGFSQGGCLGSEFVARNPRRYGGFAALSGGLIGESIDPDDYLETDGVSASETNEGSSEQSADGDLEGTPVFLGCSDVDPHIPLERVHETKRVLESLGADVTERIYEGMGHGVNEDELEFVSGMVDDLLTDEDD
ncbi:alpha/beta hydrolase [Natrialba swarupiae]|uniref:Prolyl oligopeptidase family serine peptidase n=1 Tax=Natrialba swarupiae TaxID=2448032 RepID=A0A5D5AWF3_9EURY|nr:dienelactone hydrolase family protein [Natrialba swarupiae]TYT63970.1 prolyl oligopeptidase family serine peptidase [Natrialba swarupiae]